MDYGVIEEIKNNKIYIKIESTGECSTCPGKIQCDIFSKGKRLMEIKNTYKDNFKIGERISFSFTPKARVISAIIIFLIPVISLILFYYIGLMIFKNSNIAIISSLSGLLLSFLIIFIIIKFLCTNILFKPIIKKIDNMQNDNN